MSITNFPRHAGLLVPDVHERLLLHSGSLLPARNVSESEACRHESSKLTFAFLSRGSLILEKRAAALTKETGKPYYIRGSDNIELMTFGERVKISLTRPLLYLFTEPIVAIMALWIGTAWGGTSWRYVNQRLNP